MPTVVRHSRISLITPPPSVVVPRCPHGPALLFSRVHSASGRSHTFYACSAARDRRSCPLHVPADAAGRPLSSPSPPVAARRPATADLAASRRLLRSPTPRLLFCRSCALALPPDAANAAHAAHQVVSVSRRRARLPCRLLSPLTANHDHAQFLFDARALALVLGMAGRSGAARLLCVGCPRLMEASAVTGRRPGLLLDLDRRFRAFYGRRRFLRFNMFNRHVFGRRGLGEIMEKVGGGEPWLVVCDPPFGGMVEALAETLEWVRAQGKTVGMVLVMPYFMEKRIREHLPRLRMLDYPITYDNHPRLSNPKTTTVRLFTDLPSQVCRPPTSMAADFRFCAACDRYSASANPHCDLCHACTTKHGPTFRHCRRCKRCVKPSRRHCERCGWCVLPDEHACGAGQTLIHRR